jgi:hypothetical protein
MMKRREFITLLGSAAAWPFAARAEQAKPMVGFVSGGSPGPFAYLVRAFRQGLNETGYVEGQNLAIEFRWAEGRYDRLPDLVTDLIRLEASVLAATIKWQSLTMGKNGLFVRSEAKEGRSASAPGRSMLSRHAGGGQRGARHMVLAARGADRKAAADGMRAIIDESGSAVGWRATGSASWSQQLDLAIVG